jgi:hypothetical protein
MEKMQEFDYKLTIIGKTAAPSEEIAKMLVLQGVSITIDTLGTNPAIDLAVRPATELVIASSIPQQGKPH